MSDLELYVASEIQMRTFSDRLKIKHSEVKEKIINMLIHEADEMLDVTRHESFFDCADDYFRFR